jgi:hypothetical protein
VTVAQHFAQVQYGNFDAALDDLHEYILESIELSMRT